MKRCFLFIIIITFQQLYSQSSCPNSDFESGTLTGWQGQTGSCCPISTSASAIITGRHTIMTGNGKDANTCDHVQVVAPGGLYSARVGNERTGAEAESLSYRMTVTPSSTLFIYKYAVVLQDPGHEPEEQPRFQVRVLNAAGQLIDPTCGQYTVVAQDGLEGFQTCANPDGDIRYRDWTTVGLDLSSYMGQVITVEFETGDCSIGGHFGYAYVDAYCSPLQIGASYCSGSFAAELTAPIGFSSYLWNTGATTRSIIVTNPSAGLNYSCLLTSVTGCQVSISTVLQLEDPSADFQMTNTCYNNAVFQNTTILNNPNLLDGYIWDFGDGTTSFAQHPTHAFPATGTYTVKFTASNAFGCTTTATKTITVVNAPTAQISYGETNFCTSDTIVKSIALSGTDQYTGGTYSVDVPGLSFNPLTAEFNPSTSAPGTYIISYSIPTVNGCTVPPSTTTITIYLAPQANLSYGSATFCNTNNAPVYANLTGVGNFIGGNYESIPAGLSISSSTGTIRPELSIPGSYIVTYTIPPRGGVCSPVDAIAIVNIVAAPSAVISYRAPFCNSVTVAQHVTLTGTGNFTTGSYSSSPAGLHLNSGNGDIIPSLSTPGNYTVAYTIPAAGACSSIVVNTNVLIAELPTAAISYADPYCRSITSPEPVILTGTAAYTGGTFAAPTGVSINSTTGGIIPSASIAGTHQIIYNIPATLGCAPAPVSTLVTLLPLPEPILSNYAICEDPRGHIFRPAILDTGLSDLQYSCQWFFNGAVIPAITSNQYTVAAAGNYSVLVTNIATGCISPQAASTVSTAVTVEDFITYVTNTFEQNNTMTVLVNGGTGPYLFSIDNQPFQVSNVFAELTPGIHTVKVTDANYCTDVTKRVMVLGYPNYFTPNGDGNNDYWNIYYFDTHPNAKIYIYDRYGKMLALLSPQSPGWDGTYNGKLMPSTDYWFQVEFLDYDENGELVWQTFKSHFSMLR
ncbi:MAG: T9SS type B sorting domain-containing protein [Flavobacterium sp.]